MISMSFKIVSILWPILMIVYATPCKQLRNNDKNVQHDVSLTKKYTCSSLISNEKDICLTWRREPSPWAPWRNFPAHRKLCWHSPMNKQIQFHILFIVRLKLDSYLLAWTTCLSNNPLMTKVAKSLIFSSSLSTSSPTIIVSRLRSSVERNPS